VAWVGSEQTSCYGHHCPERRGGVHADGSNPRHRFLEYRAVHGGLQPQADGTDKPMDGGAGPCSATFAPRRPTRRYANDIPVPPSTSTPRADGLASAPGGVHAASAQNRTKPLPSGLGCHGCLTVDRGPAALPSAPPQKPRQAGGPAFAHAPIARLDYQPPDGHRLGRVATANAAPSGPNRARARPWPAGAGTGANPTLVPGDYSGRHSCQAGDREQLVKNCCGANGYLAA
jgi:hypothetical protein